MLHLIRNMSINIECEGCCGMSEIFLNGFDVVSALDRGHRIGVAQIMKSGVGQAKFLHNALKAVIRNFDNALTQERLSVPALPYLRY
jgi:hypothetical protein